MKKVEAIIKSFKLDELRQELSSAGVQRLSVSEPMEAYELSGFDFLPKVKLEIIVAEDRAARVVATIERAAPYRLQISAFG